ncbi:TadE/TadG family type IV pilus assembly protein [Methylobacterium sp. HMF5984]|uniref:TadE/TadG family type IV pilus assembly protein n=1 Tax=Methylobacterium sp. HMF5984 TaxID=3367370 RepID=UPI003854B645
MGMRAGRGGGRLAACRGGNAAVEFALVTPLLLLLFAGISAFGIYLGATHTLREIAAEAARASVAGVSDGERASLAQAVVQRSLAASAMFKAGSVGVSVGTSPSDATVYTVTLTYDSSGLGLKSLGKLVPLPPDIFTSTVSVRRGGL